jgi:hypothetical protein
MGLEEKQVQFGLDYRKIRIGLGARKLIFAKYLLGISLPIAKYQDTRRRTLRCINI